MFNTIKNKTVKKITTILIASAFAMFVMPTLSMAQCDEVVLQGCIDGACGNTDPLSTTLTSDGAYTLTVGNSLCGAQGTRVMIMVNKKRINANLDNSGTVEFSASAGDVVTIDATARRIDGSIICIWAGQIDLTLCRNL